MQQQCAKHVFEGAEDAAARAVTSSAPNVSSTPSDRTSRRCASSARWPLPASERQRGRGASPPSGASALHEPRTQRPRHHRLMSGRPRCTRRCRHPPPEPSRVTDVTAQEFRQVSRFPRSRQWSGGVAPLVVCSKCGERNEDGQEFCRNQACGAYLPFVQSDAPAAGGPGPVAPQQPQRAAPPRAPQKRGVRVALSQSIGTVTPGESVATTLTIVNGGTVVEQFETSVTGISPEWVTVQPPVVSLMPGAEAGVAIRLHPVRNFRHQPGTTRLLRVDGLDGERRSVCDCVGIVRSRDLRRDRRRAHTSAIRDGTPGEASRHGRERGQRAGADDTRRAAIPTKPSPSGWRRNSSQSSPARPASSTSVCGRAACTGSASRPPTRST